MAKYVPSGNVRNRADLNGELQLVADAINDQLDKTGGSGNQMEADLDMNSQRILNLPEPVNPFEPARLQDLSEILSAIEGSSQNDGVDTFTATLSQGQTDVVAPYAIEDCIVFVTGINVDSALLVPVTDYNSSGTTLTLLSNYPVGTRVTVIRVSKTLNINSAGSVTVATLQDMISAPFIVGNYVTVEEYGGALFRIFPDDTTVETGDHTLSNGLIAKLQYSSGIVKPEWYSPLSGDPVAITNAMNTAETLNLPLVLSEAATVNIPTDASTLQTVLDLTAPVSSSVPVTVNFESGHQPVSGATINGRDYSNYTITATDGTVVAGGAFDSWLVGTYSTFPTVSCILDSNSLVDIGIHLVNACKGRVTSGSGVVNSVTYNFQMRSSRADVEGGVFNGAGETGVRVTQASQIKAQSSQANNCGVIGYDISRGSTANVMLCSATGCGFNTEVITGDPNFINQGGLVVRRSLVAADSIDVSGSTRGISVQLSAYVNAPLAVLNNCTITGARASSLSRLALGGASMLSCTTGLSAGPNTNIDATNVNFTGSTTTWAVFGSNAVVDITGSIGSSGGTGAVINSPASGGTVWDDGQANLVQHDSLYSQQFTIDSDTAVSFPVPGGGGGRGVVVAIATDGSLQNGLVYCRVTNANSSILAGGADLEVTTGPLSGNTGTAGKLTISPHSDGNIYIENRGAGTTTVGVTLLSQNML